MSKFFDGELLSGYEESPKTTIFGEEHFIDTTMIKLVQQKNEAVDNYIFEQMANSLKGSVFVEMPQVIIDKEKLKKWVVLCMKLENIEHSELVDMATKKRIADLESKLSKLLQRVSEQNEELVNRPTMEDLYPPQMIKLANQDKIDFCIEKLTKVKLYAQHIQGGLINYIEDLIKQLKEGK